MANELTKEHDKVFWIKKGETFAGKGQGEEITEYFFDEDGTELQKKRLAKLKRDGYVSTEKPINIETASEMELNQLRKTVADQAQEIADFKDAVKTAPKPSKAAAEKLSKTKSELAEVKAELAEAKKNVVPTADLEALKTELSKHEAVKTELSEAKEKTLDDQINLEYLTDMVQEMEKTWTDPNAEEVAPAKEDEPGPKDTKASKKIGKP